MTIYFWTIICADVVCLKKNMIWKSIETPINSQINRRKSITNLYAPFLSLVTHETMITAVPVKLLISIFGYDTFFDVFFSPNNEPFNRPSLSYRNRNDFSAGCSTIRTWGPLIFREKKMHFSLGYYFYSRCSIVNTWSCQTWLTVTFQMQRNVNRRRWRGVNSINSIPSYRITQYQSSTHWFVLTTFND